MSRKDKVRAKKYAKKKQQSSVSTSAGVATSTLSAENHGPATLNTTAGATSLLPQPPSSPSCGLSQKRFLGVDLRDENAQQYFSDFFAAAIALKEEQQRLEAENLGDGDSSSNNNCHGHFTAGSGGGGFRPISVTPYMNVTRDRITEEMVFGPVPDRDYHEGFMRKAIEMAEMALRSDETPVGCVFVHKGEIIGRGINGTNATLNGTRHAEFVGLAEIMSTHPQSILKETDLYVTVEPCIMCASALRQYGIRTVYFGCLNDRFGGTGGVMTVNQDPGIDPPFNVYGGLFREEAIMLLRRFYVQENEKAPEPKPKKNRELKTAILPVNVPVTRAQGPSAIARALALAKAERLEPVEEPTTSAAAPATAV